MSVSTANDTAKAANSDMDMDVDDNRTSNYRDDIQEFLREASICADAAGITCQSLGPLFTAFLEAQPRVSAAKDKDEASEIISSSCGDLEIGIRQANLQLLVVAAQQAEVDTSDKTNSVSAVEEYLMKVTATIEILVSRAFEFAATTEKSTSASNGAEVSSATSVVFSLTPNVLAIVRKLPFMLLDDVLDGFPIQTGWDFWKRNVQSKSKFFGRSIWGDATTHPCWLLFLKISNKFLERLSDSNMVVQAGEVLQLMSTVYPISEKSARTVLGSHNADNSVVVEDISLFETINESVDNDATASAAGSKKKRETIDYNFYQAFWKLQQDFRDPTSVKITDFLRRLQVVLRAFQSTIVSSSAITTSSKVAAVADTNKDDSTGSCKAVFGPFLTHSKLLKFQLSDPTLRSIVLTQFWIVAQYLMTKVPAMKLQLNQYVAQAEQILAKSEQLDFLKSSSIFNSSEPQWRKWKQGKGLPDPEAKPVAKPTARFVRKRKRPAPAWKQVDWSSSDLQQVSCDMAAAVPTVVQHLEEYVDACDPDAGIEAEYHPKNNAMFSWRALRLLSADHLDEFGSIHPSGDFECMVRDVYKVNGSNVEILGDGPPSYDVFAEEQKQIRREKEREEAEKKRQQDMLEKEKKTKKDDSSKKVKESAIKKNKEEKSKQVKEEKSKNTSQGKLMKEETKKSKKEEETDVASSRQKKSRSSDNEDKNEDQDSKTKKPKTVGVSNSYAIMDQDRGGTVSKQESKPSTAEKSTSNDDSSSKPPPAKKARKYTDIDVKTEEKKDNSKDSKLTKDSSKDSKSKKDSSKDSKSKKDSSKDSNSKKASSTKDSKHASSSSSRNSKDSSGDKPTGDKDLLDNNSNHSRKKGSEEKNGGNDDEHDNRRGQRGRSDGDHRSSRHRNASDQRNHHSSGRGDDGADRGNNGSRRSDRNNRGSSDDYRAGGGDNYRSSSNRRHGDGYSDHNRSDDHRNNDNDGGGSSRRRHGNRR